ncbi:MAG: hypothetical protein IPG86_18280 [Chitinophagaceae bacterium]|nr:hypothetical protein [Chitinophagaceae bacterium]
MAGKLYRYEIKSSLYDEWSLPEAVKESQSFNFSSTRVYALKKNCEGQNSCLYIYTIR